MGDMRKSGFVNFMVVFLFGILLGEFFMEGEWLKLAVVGVVGFIAGWRYVDKWWIVVFGLLLGFSRLYFAYGLGPDDVEVNVGEVVLHGCVVEEVDARRDKVKYTIETEAFGRVLISAARYPVYEYGDCLAVSGELKRPETFEGFEYDKYLARYDIYHVIYRARILKVEGWKGNSVRAALYRFKGTMEERLNELFAEPYASLMAGLVLGSRRGIPEDLMEDFNTTGLTHIIAISGYNITLLVVAVGAVFGFLPRRWKVVCSCFFIVLFVMLVGAGAAVVRAGIMGGIGLLAVFFGRQYYVEIALFAAVFLMNLWNPKILLFDVGFQLSFLATCGLVWVSPRFEKYFLWLPEFFLLRQSVLMTMSAQVFALPVIVMNFERLSLVAPLANAFVLPFIPLAMIFGFLALIFGGVFAFCGSVVLAVVIFEVEIFSSLDFAAVEVSGMVWWMALVYYWWILNLFFKEKLPKIVP